MTTLFTWFFADRSTGRIVIGQRPNAPLILFAGAWLANAVLHPPGLAGSALQTLEIGSLIVWAGDEVIRGVNPWRRTLGAVTLLYAMSRVAGVSR